MDSMTWIQIQDNAVYISLSINTLGKGKLKTNLVLHPAYVLELDKTYINEYIYM